jgi:hypothetical protein
MERQYAGAVSDRGCFEVVPVKEPPPDETTIE